MDTALFPHFVDCHPKLPFKPQTPKDKGYGLIYGNSSSTRSTTLQLLRPSGHFTIKTCSPESFDFIKSYGAGHTFDYRSPTCGADIWALTLNPLFYIMDCISDVHAVDVCCSAMGRAGGHYASLELRSGMNCKLAKPLQLPSVWNTRCSGKETVIEEGYARLSGSS